MDTKSFSNKTKGDNSKSKNGRVVMLSGPVLHFYQVSSKYSKGYSSYRADKKLYAESLPTLTPMGAVPNTICPPLPPTLVGGGYNIYLILRSYISKQKGRDIYIKDYKYLPI